MICFTIHGKENEINAKSILGKTEGRNIDESNGDLGDKKSADPPKTFTAWYKTRKSVEDNNCNETNEWKVISTILGKLLLIINLVIFVISFGYGCIVMYSY